MFSMEQTFHLGLIAGAVFGVAPLLTGLLKRQYKWGLIFFLLTPVVGALIAPLIALIFAFGGCGYIVHRAQVAAPPAPDDKQHPEWWGRVAGSKRKENSGD